MKRNNNFIEIGEMISYNYRIINSLDDSNRGKCFSTFLGGYTGAQVRSSASSSSKSTSSSSSNKASLNEKRQNTSNKTNSSSSSSKSSSSSSSSSSSAGSGRSTSGRATNSGSTNKTTSSGSTNRSTSSSSSTNYNKATLNESRQNTSNKSSSTIINTNYNKTTLNENRQNTSSNYKPSSGATPSTINRADNINYNRNTLNNSRQEAADKNNANRFDPSKFKINMKLDGLDYLENANVSYLDNSGRIGIKKSLYNPDDLLQDFDLAKDATNRGKTISDNSSNKTYSKIKTPTGGGFLGGYTGQDVLKDAGVTPKDRNTALKEEGKTYSKVKSPTGGGFLGGYTGQDVLKDAGVTPKKREGSIFTTVKSFFKDPIGTVTGRNTKTNTDNINHTNSNIRREQLSEIKQLDSYQKVVKKDDNYNNNYSNNNSGDISKLTKFISFEEGHTPLSSDGKSYLISDSLDDVPSVGSGVTLKWCASYFAKYGIDVNDYGVGDYLPVDIVDKVKEDVVADKRKYVEDLARNNNINLTDNQIDALTSRAYQFGNIEKFPDAYRAANGDMDAFVNDYMMSGGYNNRRERESNLFRNGYESDNGNLTKKSDVVDI